MNLRTIIKAYAPLIGVVAAAAVAVGNQAWCALDLTFWGAAVAGAWCVAILVINK